MALNKLVVYTNDAGNGTDVPLTFQLVTHTGQVLTQHAERDAFETVEAILDGLCSDDPQPLILPVSSPPPPQSQPHPPKVKTTSLCLVMVLSVHKVSMNKV